MSLAKLNKTPAKRVLGIDASTHSVAFCIFNGDDVESYGEIFFDGGDVYERILDAKRKMSALRKIGFFDVDFMAIEAGVMVRSAATGIKMAYIFGAIMGEVLDDGIKVVEVHPVTWQSFIGNKNFNKAEKEEVYREYPGKSKTWYSNKIRTLRKERTLLFMAGKGIITKSDNVADAAGISYYAVNNLTRQNIRE